jgi:hypothetical protein
MVILPGDDRVFAHEDPRQPEKESSSRHRRIGEDPLSAGIAQSAGLQCWTLGLRAAGSPAQGDASG